MSSKTERHRSKIVSGSQEKAKARANKSLSRKRERCNGLAF